MSRQLALLESPARTQPGPDPSLGDAGDVSSLASLDASPGSRADTSSPGRPDGARRCAWCGGDLAPGARADAIYCGQSHRQAAWRFSRQVARAAAAVRPVRLAFADPPYPDCAHYYAGHPDYAGEVDHRALLSRLQEYDGWALCTNTPALRHVLRLCDELRLDVSVAAWFRGPRVYEALRPVQAWEPVVFAGGRRVLGRQPTNALVHVARPRLTDPNRVIGAKPAAFASWVFELLGARRGDTLDDLFPGSGGVARAWDIYTATPPNP